MLLIVWAEEFFSQYCGLRSFLSSFPTSPSHCPFHWYFNVIGACFLTFGLMAPVGCEVVLNKDALFNLGACWLYKWNSQVFLVCVAFLPEQKKNKTKQKQPQFHDATTGFSATWRPRNEYRNSTLMTWLKPISYAAITNQKQADLGSDASSVWNFCTRSSDVVSQGNQWWDREISAVFSGCVAFFAFAVLVTFFVLFFFSF